ncbi:Dps family protein [Paenibacillus thalictri]|uniref:DNA starvation/stationary phase protection protein n=1 Tax=Paenibacillus thalictri TaxID=2527873 RepID=A0A4Q9E074_9BACL|nr:Dps family protein [Paenibacillus thalictri]TBL81618.1 DNA starvation/stationary phase protection protein [Paenibacillus thalictri]
MVIDALNRQLANWNVLYVKLHNFHWNVKGPQFFVLHPKFQELYEEAATHVDDLAERVLALKGTPYAKMSDYLQYSGVKEASGGESAEEMVAAVASDYTLMVGELKEAMALAQQSGDEPTADMLLSIQTELEKHVWMLSAFLK